jgi:hypothetical protein
MMRKVAGVDMNDAHNMAQGAAQVSGGAVAAASAKHTFIAVGSGLTLATIVVMAMTMPRSKREFFVALISTVVSSFCGGAFVIQYFDLLPMAQSATTQLDMFLFLAKLGGVFFVCGLPGWIFVRSCFVWSESRKDAGIDTLIADIRNTWD